MGQHSKSSLRIFLSADLVGSTRLKNRLNHQELLAKYQARQEVIVKLRAQTKHQISDEEEQKAILQSLAISTEDFDWATVIREFYSGIQAEFMAALDLARKDSNLEIGKNLAPWKAIGDELIYSVEVNGRKELHYITLAFLRAMRLMDRKLSKGSAQLGLRIKGAAWVAGFPVRNRVIELPYVSQSDYLGPEMDTGFRIAKCTRSGMLVASVELVELLGECLVAKVSPITAMIVGWEKLSGVWNDYHYPIIWLDLPVDTPFDNCRSLPFSDWDIEECRYCKSWSQDETMKSVTSLVDKLRKLRVTLPDSLGLVDPYIIGDTLQLDEPDIRHKQILSLMQSVEMFRPEASRFDSEETDRFASSLSEDSTEVKELVNRSPSSDA